MVTFDLPWELIEEILSRVPTTTLGRVRFTCKRLNALFKDPEFIKKHMDRGGKLSLVLMMSSFSIYSLSINLNEILSFDPSTKLIGKLTRALIEPVEITQVFHCNGLLLCSPKANDAKLVVVNPCTGQTKWIKRERFYDMDMFALGYANNNNKSYDSYKVLRFPFGCKTLEIFKFKSNSWRVITNIDPKVDIRVYERGLSLKENTYWLSYMRSDIWCFDFTTERFRRLDLSLPPVPFPNSSVHDIVLSVVEEKKLSVLRGSQDMRQMEIWLSNKIGIESELSWKKLFTIDLRSELNRYTRFLRSMSFLVDQERKVVVLGFGRRDANDKNIIYIVGKGGCKKFDYDMDINSINSQLFLFSYVPSFVSVNPPM